MADTPNTYTTAEELLAYTPTVGQDTYGRFHIITGYEGSGACFWCGEDLEGRRRRFCGGRSGCWTKYANAFYWTYARVDCLKAYDDCCANCGLGTQELYNIYAPKPNNYLADVIEATLEVHHIIPLDGRIRQSSPFNLPWNLICLCHLCHLDIAAVMRLGKHPSLSAFDIAVERGQLILAGVAE